MIERAPRYDPQERWALAALLLLSSVACVHLTALPVFEDEGTQLRWIFRIIEAGDWLQPLGDGKPLEAWPAVPLVMLPVQPIVATRALHVVLGMIGTACVYSIARQLTTRWAALTAAVLFALCPFVVYMQRLALSDTWMCTAGLWVTASVVRFIAAPTRARAALLAAALWVAAFSKFPVGFVFLAWMPLALVLMPAEQRRVLLRQPAFGRTLLAHAPAILLALLVMAVAGLRWHSGRPPGFGLNGFVGIALGGYRIATNLGVASPSLAVELAAQLSWPVIAIGLVGLAVSAAHADWRRRWLIAIGVLPLLAIGLLARFWYSRYLLFTLPPLILTAVDGWDTLAERAARFRVALEVAVPAVCGLLFASQSLRLIVNPAGARWSSLDRFQYFEGWSSGYGYPQAAQFILAAPNAPANIYSLDGHSAYQLRNYLPAAWHARIGPIFYGSDGQLLRSDGARLQNLLAHTPAWIVISPQLLDSYLSSALGPDPLARMVLRPIAVFDKPEGRSQLALYQVTRR